MNYIKGPLRSKRNNILNNNGLVRAAFVHCLAMNGADKDNIGCQSPIKVTWITLLPAKRSFLKYKTKFVFKNTFE